MLEKAPGKSPAKKTGATKAAAPKVATRRTAVRKPRAAAPAADPQALIRQRAYELWERDGRPEGRDQHHWTEAEQEIAAQRAA